MPRAPRKARDRLIFALDVPNGAEALRLSQELESEVGLLKVGLELFIAEGMTLVRDIATKRPVFLDLKLHDIPETVERAVARAVEHEIAFLTLHATGGPAMLERAARRAEGSKTTLLAVTVLTSMDALALAATGVEGSVETHVLRLANMARNAGIKGLVASANELASLRDALGDLMTLVIPGIRPGGALANDDQARASTPEKAIRAGADFLVVGRPIRDASDRVLAARAIVREIEKAESLPRVPSPEKC